MARILVIDDEPNIRKMVRVALQKDGYTVEQAADGIEGLERFGDGTGWDLVLLDQRMPGVSGLEVLREMLGRAPTGRIVMITAFGTIDLAVEAMKAGATDFLRKPFTLGMLRGSVRAAIGGTAAGDHGQDTVVSFTTLNGYRIESLHQPGEMDGSELVYHFQVRNPAGTAEPCTVRLPAYVMELVKAQSGQDEMPGGDAFWRGFCEEALANYVWQNARAPAEPLRICELTRGLRHWTDAVLAAGR